MLTPVFNEEVILFNLLDQSFTDPISSVSIEVICRSETDEMTHSFSKQIPTDHTLVLV